jgi:hypothetical protein
MKIKDKIELRFFSDVREKTIPTKEVFSSVEKEFIISSYKKLGSKWVEMAKLFPGR